MGYGERLRYIIPIHQTVGKETWNGIVWLFNIEEVEKSKRLNFSVAVEDLFSVLIDAESSCRKISIYTYNYWIARKNARPTRFLLFLADQRDEDIVLDHNFICLNALFGYLEVFPVLPHFMKSKFFESFLFYINKNEMHIS